jgi:hypothetical protein
MTVKSRGAFMPSLTGYSRTMSGRDERENPHNKEKKGGNRDSAASDGRAEDRGERTGTDQAAANREVDPPA